MSVRTRWLVVGIAVAMACGESAAGPGEAGRLPLPDLAGGTYKGFVGGLYPAGSNSVPSAHAAVGEARARNVVPRDTSGAPSAGGNIVLLSLGMSNTSQEFCNGALPANCTASSFTGQAAADPTVNDTSLIMLNGARGGQTAQTWDAATDPNYDSVRLNRLAPLGLTERQVQVVWVKEANANPQDSLPVTQADASLLETSLGNIARALRTRYPNLQLVFFSSRIYAGYATTTLNPEPYAYESGFAVKWLVQAQIEQMASGAITDQRAGDLDYNGAAPWLAWGPYLWADGATPRGGDALVWLTGDFAADGTHPSPSGQQKVGALLLSFFKTSPFTKCWFVNGGTCP